jgi:hypothetical protein
MNLPRDMIAAPFCMPWSNSRTELACCRSRFGTKRIFRRLIRVAAARPVRRIPCCGPIRSTCVCFARLMTGRCSTRFQKSSRYRDGEADSKVEFWLPKHPIPQATKGHTLRICAAKPFRLRWTTDKWKTSQDSQSHPTGIGGEYFDVSPDDLQSQLDFTFFWPDRGANGGEWEGQNHLVQPR